MRWSIVMAVICCLCSKAGGLDPHKRYSQYLRHKWTITNGFSGGRVNSIAQTADGFLWIGTSKALVRFDGFGFVSVGQYNQSTDPISQALSLVSDPDGDLWVWDQSMNVQRYRNGKFYDIAPSVGTERGAVSSISRSIEGGLLVATLAPRIFRYQHGSGEAISGEGNLWIPPPQALAETTDGKIWMATYEAGLFYWERGRTIPVKSGVPDSKINCLLPVENGGLWIGTDNGLVLWNGQDVSSRVSSAALRGARILSLLKDRDSNLWIGTSAGLFRLNSGGLSLMDDGQKSSSTSITAIFEDREGNLWVGEAEGIERLRDGLFTAYPIEGTAPVENTGPIYVDAADRTWVAPAGGGLYRIESGKATPIATAQLGRDVIYSIAGFGDDLWVGRREGGLTHLTHLSDSTSGASYAKTYTHQQGLAQNSVSSVFRSSDGTVWAGTLSGGVSRLTNGKFSTLTSSDGLGSNSILSIQEGMDGAMWFATSDGLSRLAKGKLNTYRARDGLPSDEVNTLFADSSGVLWVGTSQGLAYVSSGRVFQVVDAHPALHESILGLTEDGKGSLWLTSSNHVFRATLSGLLRGALGDQEYREYGEEDGLRGTEGVRRDRSIVADNKGHVWLSTSHGVSMGDWTRLGGGVSLALPHVVSVSSDGNQASLDDPIRIGPDPQRISITYQAVDLAVPDRVRYRYKLEGFDHAWSDPTEARQVVYTNLGPGPYRFGLLASNGNGGWNGSETVLSFKIEPTLWQTWWFRVSMSMSAAGILWLLYLYRLKLATRRIQERLDARLEERERIARELHDTLLQGFQGLMLRLQAVSKKLPAQEAAHQMLEQVLDRADQVLLEGRERVKDLRQTHITGDELSEVLIRYVEELNLGCSTLFSLVVSGTPQALGPVVFDEVTRIAREALVNCFQHAKASKIEAEIAYSNSAFSLRILDDGIGIDETLVHSGRAGHWGIAGMRERAQRIGGKFNIRTSPGNGTEIDLTIAAKLAFPNRLRSMIFGRLKKRGPRRS